MRVIQVTPNFPPNGGGIGSYVFYLSRELIRQRHDVSVIFRGDKNQTYLYGGICVKEVKLPWIPPFNLWKFKKIVETILADEKANIVVVHSSAMPVIKCDCPVVVTSHCCNKEFIPTCHRPIKDLDALYRNIMLPVYVRIEANLVRCCDKLTVVSKSLQREYKRNYGVNSDVTYNAVDISLFNSDDGIEKENAVLFTGRLCVGKGVLDLLEIATRLEKSHPKTRVYLVGNGLLNGHIKSMKKKGKFSNVTLIGHLPHIQLVEYYRRSRIYVLPSHYEGFPTGTLEAMACKLPVVASNIAGIPDQIDEGVNGYMVPPRDIQGFYNRIVELLDNVAKQRSFGQMGRKKVLEKFTWPTVGQNVLRIYQELLI